MSKKFHKFTYPRYRSSLAVSDVPHAEDWQNPWWQVHAKALTKQVACSLARVDMD